MNASAMMESATHFGRTCFPPLMFEGALPVAVPVRRNLSMALIDLEILDHEAVRTTQLWLFCWDAEGNINRAERLP